MCAGKRDLSPTASPTRRLCVLEKETSLFPRLAHAQVTRGANPTSAAAPLPLPLPRRRSSPPAKPAGELGWRRRGLLRGGVPSQARGRRRSPASGSDGGEASGLGDGRSGAAVAGSGQPLRFSAGVLAAVLWGQRVRRRQGRWRLVREWQRSPACAWVMASARMAARRPALTRRHSGACQLRRSARRVWPCRGCSAGGTGGVAPHPPRHGVTPPASTAATTTLSSLGSFLKQKGVSSDASPYPTLVSLPRFLSGYSVA
uniref:Uncharacterized protein n=1 Tax=Oryza meridionalis TaxID=40149 RepID=A0A0E0EPE4_9ORYZ